LQKIAFQVGGPSWNWAVCYRFATFSRRRFIGSRSTRSTPGPLSILAAAAVTTLECRRLLEWPKREVPRRMPITRHGLRRAQSLRVRADRPGDRTSIQPMADGLAFWFDWLLRVAGRRLGLRQSGMIGGCSASDLVHTSLATKRYIALKLEPAEDPRV
jgi:hypothetical protein